MYKVIILKMLKKSSSGPLVSFLQITLKNANVYDDIIDGIFGNYTFESVKRFQTLSNISVDGIMGEKTWSALLPFMSVPTTIPYTYDILELNIKSLKQKYSFIQTGRIGNSVMNKELPFIKLGKGNKKIVYIARDTCK